MDKNSNVPSEKIDFFTCSILEWGAKNKRNFVWRKKNRSFFTVLIAEFFLRKTKSEVVDSFLRNSFFKKYKSFCDLANESVERLKSLLRPLGLQNQRSTALNKIATLLCGSDDHPSYEEILRLPHCGRYIASAVDCFFYGNKRAIVDHNVLRVFHRFFSVPEDTKIFDVDQLWSFAEEVLPDGDFVNFNYFLLDFSSLVCKPRKPLCVACPLSRKCDFYKKQKT